MPLPFLKDKKASVAGLIIKNRAPDEKPQENQEDKDASIHACAQDLINSIQSNNVKGAAEAIRAAFEILDSEPHIEGEHIEPHSYDAQNQKAAKNE